MKERHKERDACYLECLETLAWPDDQETRALFQDVYHGFFDQIQEKYFNHHKALTEKHGDNHEAIISELLFFAVHNESLKTTLKALFKYALEREKPNTAQPKPQKPYLRLVKT